jgi:dihydroorotase
MSTLLGLKGMPPESESVMVARDIMLTGLTRSRLHVCHVSTGRSFSFIKDGKTSGVDVTCEVTPHHFALTDEAVRTYDTNAKMNPPLRSERDMGAVRQALRSGLVDAIATDHAPHSTEEKDQEFNSAPFGVVGLETALGLACTCLYHEGIVSLSALIRLMSTNPAGILGLTQGTLKQGSPGDVTVFDPDREWTVDPARFQSKSRNSPFSDWKLKGRAVSVIVGGRVLLRDGELS